MANHTQLAVLIAVGLVLGLFLLVQLSAPEVSSTRVGLDTSVESILRTAVNEMREMRSQVSMLEERVHKLQQRSRTSSALSTSGASPGALVESAVNAQSGSSSAPSSFVDAVSLDEPASNISVLAKVMSSQPECGMLVFRHVEKTGGTTFRMHMVALHDCGWHVWGYKGTIRLCNKAKFEWGLLQNPSLRPNRDEGPMLPHLTVESHAESGDFVKMLDGWVPMVNAWRGTCGIWLISILREPLRRQVSHYSYHKTTRGFDIKHIHNFTHYFSDQYVLLNRKSANDQFLQRHILLPRLLYMERRRESVAALQAYATSELAKFDVIGVFENYTASMLLIARATGLPLSKYSAPTIVKNRDIKPHRSKVKQIWDDELATPQQRAFFTQHLQLDYWLYEQVRARFDSQVRAGGREFEAQLHELMRADATQLDTSLDRICESGCESGLDKEQSTNRFVWKNQQCWPLAERELKACGANPHLRPDFNYQLCG